MELFKVAFKMTTNKKGGENKEPLNKEIQLRRGGGKLSSLFQNNINVIFHEIWNIKYENICIELFTYISKQYEGREAINDINC